MIGDLKKGFHKLIDAAIGEDNEALERAVKAGDIGLARQIVGGREGLRQAKDLFTEAVENLDLEEDDDDDSEDVDELTKGDT